MNIAAIAHLPAPSERLHTDEFWGNMERNMPRCPIITFSDHYPLATIQVKPFPQRKDPFYLQNLAFLTAARIAVKRELDWFIYLEVDCRVRAGWDEKLVENISAVSQRIQIDTAGTQFVRNPCNGGYEAWRKFLREFANKYSMPAWQLPRCYGNKGMADGSGSAVCVMGALGCYRVAALAELFPEIKDGSTIALAGKIKAFDVEIGERLWAKHGAGAYDRVLHLRSVFSTYGNVLTTEQERIHMLKDGEVFAIHQVKSKHEVI